MQTQVSVIICTRNPHPAVFARTLEALRLQTLSTESWELLVIDNASTPPLQETVDLSWHRNHRFAVEPQLGTNFARVRGLEESAAELLVFVDDDNLLDADYLEHAYQLAKDWPMIGVWGGRIIGEFEAPPPDWAVQHLQLLAVRDLTRDRWSNQTLNYWASPPGAGMCLRRKVAEEYVRRYRADPIRAVFGRKGQSLVAGEDTDLAFTACDMGLGNGLFVCLKLTHVIAARRLELSYLLRMMEATSFALVILSLVRGVWPPHSSAKKLADYLRRFRYTGIDRKFKDAERRGYYAAFDAYKRLNPQQLDEVARSIGADRATHE